MIIQRFFHLPFIGLFIYTTLFAYFFLVVRVEHGSYSSQHFIASLHCELYAFSSICPFNYSYFNDKKKRNFNIRFFSLVYFGGSRLSKYCLTCAASSCCNTYIFSSSDFSKIRTRCSLSNQISYK